MIRRQRGGVGIQKFKTEKIVEVDHAAAGDAVAVIDEVGQRVVDRASEVEVATGLTRPPDSGAGIERSATVETALDDYRFELIGLVGGAEYDGGEVGPGRRSDLNVADVDRLESRAINDDEEGAERDIFKTVLTMAIGFGGPAEVGDDNARASVGLSIRGSDATNELTDGARGSGDVICSVFYSRPESRAAQESREGIGQVPVDRLRRWMWCRAARLVNRVARLLFGG